jgi:signal peptide peptidase SppA
MKPLAHVAARFFNTPLAIHPPKLEVIIRALAPRLGSDAQILPHSEVSAVLAEQYESSGGGDSEYQIVDGVAVIGVQGTLLKKDSWMSAWSGCTSYQSLQRQVAASIDDDRVDAILLDIDSPGGETTGCFELSDYIYSVRGFKPIYAVANDMALSAAYAIASAAQRVYVTRTGTVGSVGVYALHVEQSGFDKQTGIKYNYIHHGAKKVDANPHEPLSEGAEADIQAEVNRQGSIFVETVARNRRCSSAKVQATGAGLLWADGAVPLFADEVGTLDDAVNALRSIVQVSSPDPVQDRARVGRAVTPVTPRVVGEIQGHANEKERETGMITPRTTKTNEAAIVQVLETEATAVKLRSRGTVTPNVYVAGETRSMTKEQAAAQALEDNPEVYEAYRRAHNAGPVLRALRDAGVIPQEQ